jgi:hypothetical protein
VAAALSEYAKNAPLIGSFDSLEIMERVMRHFYLRALVEQRMGPGPFSPIDHRRCSSLFGPAAEYLPSDSAVGPPSVGL